jgi:hypothetical protein
MGNGQGPRRGIAGPYLNLPKKYMTEPLFNIKYISSAVQKQLKPGFIVRPLSAGDYDKGTACN